MTQNDNSIKPIYFLLHGWGGSTASLKSLELLLGEMSDSIHNIEYPGFGDMKELKKILHLKDYSDFLYKTINDLNPEKRPTVLIGHSFGGKMILDLLSKENPNVLKAFIINASGIKPKQTLKLILLKRLAIFKFLLRIKILRKIFYKFIVRESDYLKTNGYLKETFKNVINEHLDGKLSKINSKVVIIWGENDVVTPLYMAKKFKNSLRNSKLFIVKNTGHSLPLKHPEEVFKIIQSEINKVNY